MSTTSKWPELDTAKGENRRELVLSGEEVSKRIQKDGIPPMITTLTALNFLDIHDTVLDVLPENLSELSNLQNLVLHSNKLTSLPKSIGKLAKLKILDVSGNKLVELPNDLTQLSELTSLNASLNELTHVPDLRKNTKLICVNLSNNKLEQFPAICAKEMVHLSDVTLKNNKIDVIPCEVNELVALKHLDLSSNAIKVIPAELSDCSKLKDLNLKENPVSDKRLKKLIDQCLPKQILDYVRKNSPRTKNNGAESNSAGVSGANDSHSKSVSQTSDAVNVLRHKIAVLHVTELGLAVKLDENMSVRPHIICCIVQGVTFTDATFKKFIQLQTKLHDTVCKKRNAATIATHDLDKIKSGDLLYTKSDPNKIQIQPLGRNGAIVTAAELYAHLREEAEIIRKEKKRSNFSGLHKYIHLLEREPAFPYLKDSDNQVISLPPITNSEITKMSCESKNIFIEVTSSISSNTCRKILDTLILELVKLGISEKISAVPSEGTTGTTGTGFYSLNVQQVKIVDLEGKLKTVYPSKLDLIYENERVSIIRET